MNFFNAALAIICLVETDTLMDYIYKIKTYDKNFSEKSVYKNN